MYDYFHAVPDCFIHSVPIADISLDKLEILVLQAAGNIPPFGLGVVKVIEIIDPDYLPAIAEKTLAQMRANETGGAG
jgi:hypothetical protein